LLCIILISAVVIRIHTSKCSWIRCVLVLDLTLFIKLHSWSQWQVLPNADKINKVSVLISGNYFSSYRVTELQEIMQAAKKMLVGHGLITPGLKMYAGLRHEGLALKPSINEKEIQYHIIFFHFFVLNLVLIQIVMSVLV
jgi:hypothetical protein